MFCEKNPALNAKRIAALGADLHDGAQNVDEAHQQVVAAPLHKVGREEIPPTWMPAAPAPGHAGSVTSHHIRRHALQLLRPGC
jgi:hypothetical protein